SSDPSVVSSSSSSSSSVSPSASGGNESSTQAVVSSAIATTTLQGAQMKVAFISRGSLAALGRLVKFGDSSLPARSRGVWRLMATQLAIENYFQYPDIARGQTPHAGLSEDQKRR